MKIWIDGGVVEAGEAKLPVTDHGLLYGDGVFEGMRVFDGAVFRLDDHLARLATGARALETIQKVDDIAAVLCDVKMPGMDGLEALHRIKEHDPDLPVVMISGHGTVETAVEATRRGAFDFLEKPLDRDRLLLSLRNALGQLDLQRSNLALKQEIASQYEIVGASAIDDRVGEERTGGASVLVGRIDHHRLLAPKLEHQTADGR